MKVSISQALKNVASEKYNKQNIFLFFLVILAASITSLFIPTELQNPELMKQLIPNEIIALLTSPKTIIPAIVCVILCLFELGYTLISVNNAIYEKEEICLNPFTNFGKMLAKGFVCSVGSAIVYILICILAIIPTMLLVKISPYFFIIIFFFVLVMVHAWLCVFLRFCITLNFKDWFSFKSSWIMIANNARRYGSYIGKSILLSITYLACIFMVGLFFGIILGIMGITTSIPTTVELAIDVLIIIISSIFTCLFYMYSIDLTAQMLYPMAKEEPEKISQEETSLEE